jgi:L-arabinokinase
MGGIADYSGALVLQMPLNLCTSVRVRKRVDNRIRIQSTEGRLELDLTTLLSERGTIVERGRWKPWQIEKWSLYILGCLFVLLDERDFDFYGLDIEVHSEVPIGKGVSSSAALEVATMGALYQAYGLPPEREALAVMAQRAENYVAGAPCGIMDQMAVHLGRKDTLLPILCQPYELFEPIPIPNDFRFFGLDTGVKHAVGGGTYGRVRTAAFMGLTIIQKFAGQSFNCLANISLDDFETQYKALLPDYLSGKDFVKNYSSLEGMIGDIEEETIYPILAATKHPIYEHHRIYQFKAMLESENPDLNVLGAWMMESHQGYMDCGLSCSEADAMIEMIRRRMGQGEVFGARITGGGLGGTVCILARTEAVVSEIKTEYEAAIGLPATLFAGSGDGAYYL